MNPHYPEVAQRAAHHCESTLRRPDEGERQAIALARSIPESVLLLYPLSKQSNPGIWVGSATIRQLCFGRYVPALNFPAFLHSAQGGSSTIERNRHPLTLSEGFDPS